MRGKRGSWVWGTVWLALGCGGETQSLGDVDEGGAGGKGKGNAGSTQSGAGGAAASSPPNGGGGYLPLGGIAGQNSFAGRDACETDCFLNVLTRTAASCKLCHASQPAPSGLQSSGLDLQSPGFTARLKDVAAKHTDLPMQMTAAAAGCPIGDKLIDTVRPENSWLLKKLKNQQGNCGTSMPQPPTTLSAQEMQCMETYVHCVAGK